MSSDALTRLTSGAVDVIPEGGLQAKLALGRPLRVKFGVDPSRPDLTLGHTVVLRKLRQFQDAGHVAVLIIGDFTARIGDPSGQSETRPILTEDEVAENARTYLEQAGAVIDVERAEMHGNAEWSSPMDMGDLLRLATTATVAQMLDRDDFRARYEAGRPIAVVEFLYPLFQAYDSVAVNADVELGGTDQTFNLLMGREVQRAYGLDPQVVLTMPLLEGTDGVRKMSKSLGNYIGIVEPPAEMFGKLMSIPDQLITKYELLGTDLGPEDNARVAAGLADGSIHPGEEKRRMARTVVEIYHGPGAGDEAEAAFDRVFRKSEAPQDVPDVTVPKTVFSEQSDGWVLSTPALLQAMGLAASRSEARRLLAQGGVRIDGQQAAEEGLPVDGEPPGQYAGSVWQVGKRRFARLAGLADDGGSPSDQ